jgi:hypothetical protein
MVFPGTHVIQSHENANLLCNPPICVFFFCPDSLTGDLLMGCGIQGKVNGGKRSTSQTLRRDTIPTNFLKDAMIRMVSGTTMHRSLTLRVGC